MEENKEEKKKTKEEQIKEWLKNKDNLAFLGVFLFAVILRIYYFIITKTQPLWWDEADYMAYAQNLAGINPYWTITAQHNSIFPYAAALFMKIGDSEAVMRFFLGVIPSLLVVLLIYKICALLYKDKKIAVVSSFLSAVLFEILFNTFRFHVDIPALFFGLLAIYVFFQGYEKKEKIFGKINPNYAIPIAVIFVLLSYGIRRGYFLFGAFFLLYLLFTHNLKDLAKDKYNWIGLGLAILLIAVLEMLIFNVPITEVAAKYAHEEVPINLSSFDVFKIFFSNPYLPSLSILFYLFYIGLVLIVSKIILYTGHFKKSGSIEAKADLFFIITILATMSYFIFFQRATDYGEARWYLPLILAAFICISRASVFIYNHTKKFNKTAAVILLVLLIGYGGYYEVKSAGQSITAKASSFEGTREAGFLLNEISNPTDAIISVPLPQMIYYSKRNVISPKGFLNVSSNQNVTLQDFISKLKTSPEIKYIIVSFAEPNHPDWMRKDYYYTNPNTGQTSLAKWEIPFMQTSIDFLNKKQDIKQTATYGDISFEFVAWKTEVFIYEIKRNQTSASS
ncbi:glycosyltransferase family 39 protein [Candidatus Pacearchaeota archaeon]|nr:glycosyltransferase family 39 protein [Candidatus Pacearchaeota archaeon]